MHGSPDKQNNHKTNVGLDIEILMSFNSHGIPVRARVPYQNTRQHKLVESVTRTDVGLGKYIRKAH